jgi:predicted nucleic acid-binding protein
VRGILDTSIFIATEQGRPLTATSLPDFAAISIVTLAELELGVHLAASEDSREVRLRTLRSAQLAYVALPVDQAVASAFARLVAAARGEGRRPRIQDTWIAATALVMDAPVYTQDSDFDDFPDVGVVRV